MPESIPERTEFMWKSRWNLLVAFGTILALDIAARAEDRPGAALSPRGGHLVKTARHQFEVFFYPTGLRVLAQGTAEAPVVVSKLSGTATFTIPGAPDPFVYSLKGTAPVEGREPTSLDLRLDLSRVPASGAKVSFQLEGLGDPAEPRATFGVPFTPVPRPTGSAPAPAPKAILISRASQADQPAINAQRVCKVSGEPLGSMGVPIKVARGERAVYLCCQGCVKTVQANPDRYLGPAK
jgi:hypothetical protein